MKPKHHKTIRYTRRKRQSKAQPQHDHHHHHHQFSISLDPNGISNDTEKSDSDDNNEEPLVKSFSAKCSTGTSSQKSRNSQFKEIDDDEDEDSDSEAERFNAMFQSVRERREQLVDRLRIYNNLFKFHKSIKEDQVYLYRTLQDMDELYLRNTAAILRLGFCPCLVHQQTSAVGDLLMRIHRKLRAWDKKTEDICEILKEPSTRKSTTAVLKILKVCENTKFGPDQPDFNDIALPEIVWDLDNPFLEELNSPKLIDDWKNVKTEIRDSLCKAEIKFQEICLEFGITRGPEQSPSSESESRPFTYENVVANGMSDREETSNTTEPSESLAQDNFIDEDGDGDDSSSIDTSNSLVSSNVF